MFDMNNLEKIFKKNSNFDELTAKPEGACIWGSMAMLRQFSQEIADEMLSGKKSLKTAVKREVLNLFEYFALMGNSIESKEHQIKMLKEELLQDEQLFDKFFSSTKSRIESHLFYIAASPHLKSFLPNIISILIDEEKFFNEIQEAEKEIAPAYFISLESLFALLPEEQHHDRFQQILSALFSNHKIFNYFFRNKEDIDSFIESLTENGVSALEMMLNSQLNDLKKLQKMKLFSQLFIAIENFKNLTKEKESKSETAIQKATRRIKHIHDVLIPTQKQFSKGYTPQFHKGVPQNLINDAKSHDEKVAEQNFSDKHEKNIENHYLREKEENQASRKGFN